MENTPKWVLGAMEAKKRARNKLLGWNGDEVTQRHVKLNWLVEVPRPRATLSGRCRTDGMSIRSCRLMREAVGMSAATALMVLSTNPSGAELKSFVELVTRSCRAVRARSVRETCHASGAGWARAATT